MIPAFPVMAGLVPDIQITEARRSSHRDRRDEPGDTTSWGWAAFTGPRDESPKVVAQ